MTPSSDPPHILASPSITIFLTYNVFPGGNYGYHDVAGSSPKTGKTYTFTSYHEPYNQLIDADISTPSCIRILCANLPRHRPL